MNDLKFEVGNEPLNEGLVEELTFDEVEVIEGGALFCRVSPKPPFTSIFDGKCGSTGKYY